MKHVVIYPGRFHPFHQGHASVYNTLVSRFPSADVFVATSDKVEPPKSPFTFDEKVKMMQLGGVPRVSIKNTKMPYRPLEIQAMYDPTDTIIMFAVSEKDMATDPRFAFKPLKDGSPSYFQPAGANMESMDKHGYIITVPTIEFKVLNKPMNSASDFRANFAKADFDTQKAMITDLYGKYDTKVHDIMSSKITESDVQRLENILITVDKIKENLSPAQLSEVTTKIGKLMIEMQVKNKRNIVEGLHELNRDDIMQSKVEVRGVGVYSVEGLMNNIKEKLDDLSSEAKSLEPFNYKNIKSKLDSGMLTLMLDSLTNAYNDIERTRRKGGAISKGIPANVFDDVEPIDLEEYAVTQSVAMKVLGNVADRKDNAPFPIRMYDKNVINVTPKIARAIINFYSGLSDEKQKRVDSLLKTYNGYKELVGIVSK